MPNHQAQVLYTYTNCDKGDFSGAVSFDEENFNQELSKVFETSIPIERVEMQFIMEDKEGSGRFTVVLRLESSKTRFEHTESSFDNYAMTVHKAIRKALEYVREAKDRQTDVR